MPLNVQLRRPHKSLFEYTNYYQQLNIQTNIYRSLKKGFSIYSSIFIL